MPIPVLGVYFVTGLILVLLWGAWVLLNLWMWQKSKANGNLLMMVGAALLALEFLFMILNVNIGGGLLWAVLGTVALTAGFYLSVKPMVEAQMAALQAKVKGMTHKDAPPSTPAK